MFQRTLCVYPYRRELNSVGFFPPLGLEFIGAIIEPHAKSLQIVDLRKEPGRTRDFLCPDLDLACFSLNWDRDPEFLAQEIRSVPPHVFTLVGGRHATLDPEHWLTECPNLDAVIRSDGEEATEELCHGLPLEEIAGLSFRKNGQVIHNPNRQLGPLRDDLYPDRRFRRYNYEMIMGGAGTGLLIDMVSSSRGCPFNCTFCSFSRNPWGQKRNWSARSPESVVDELAKIEDLFTFDMDRVEKICDLIVASGIRKNYLVNARLEIAKRPDVLRKMERAGFFMLMLGIESAHDKTLRSMRKGFDTNRIRQYFKVLRNTSMVLHGYFILGNIGESFEDMQQILPFAAELGLDTIALSVLRASPHSGLEELVQANPAYHIGSSGKIYSDECSVQQLKQLRRRINRKFYTVKRLARLARKGLQIGETRLLPDLFLHLPSIISHSIATGRRRIKRRRDKDQAKMLRQQCKIDSEA